MVTHLPRRPLKTRSKEWAKVTSHWLVQRSVSANTISLAGIFFAILAVISFFLATQASFYFERLGFYLLSALNIQLRLLCNMLDGMVALEAKHSSKTGDLFNEIPDRIEDLIILVGVGYCLSLAGGSLLGWMAAMAAVLTAYIRVLGVSLGTSGHFCGPMAKPHRMALLTGSCVLEGCIPYQGGWIVFALCIILVGSLYTCVRRIRLIVKELT